MPWLPLKNKRQDIRFLKLPYEYKGFWLDLVWLAMEYGTSGLFIENGEPLSPDDMAIKLRCQTKQLQAALGALEKVGLVSQNGRGVELIGFSEDAQPLREKRKKVEEYNKTKRGATPSKAAQDGVTPHDLTSESESESEKESEEESEPEVLPEDESSSDKESAPGNSPMTDDDPNFNKAMIAKNIGPLQREIGHTAYRILGAAGLGNPKLEKTCIELATRNDLDEVKVVSILLASLASVYANKRALNKPIVAAVQVLNDSVPAEYFDCEMWKDLPDRVLQAAGIPDINAYITSERYKRFAS
jgi:hypothetical protein